MADKKVLIIGGGIAGLCTGVYLRRLGFDTEILEMHAIAGGLATAWKKGGFTFENCVHWLVGSKDGGELNAAWKEVFDIGRIEFFDDPVFEVLERGAERIAIYRDPDRLEAELLAKAPEDAAAIKEFVGLIRRMTGFRMPEGDTFLQNLGAYLSLVPCLPALSKYSKLTHGGLLEAVHEPHPASVLLRPGSASCRCSPSSSRWPGWPRGTPATRSAGRCG